MRQKLRSASHGAVAVLWRVAEDLGLDDTFRRYFSSQVRDGLEVGMSLVLAAIHRAVEPGSKRAFSEWAGKTTLPDVVGFDAARLTSQHFWDQMNTVTDEELTMAETEITLNMMAKGLLSPRLLFYDMTNFFTYVSSDNGKPGLAQRGRNKQKRHDLKQFGLAQVVTKEFLIPVLWEVYEGNKTDRQIFIPFLLTRMREKLTDLNLDIEEITIVFDKGSNSKANFEGLDHANLGYVASLTPAYHEDLLKIPLSEYSPVKVGDKERLCYRTKKVVWGKERTIVLYLSEKLRNGQIRGLHQALGKKFEQLRELKQALGAPRAKRRKREDVQRKVDDILKGERGDILLKTTVTERDEGRFDLDWEIDEQAYQWVTEHIFGKRIIVTSRAEWSTSEIVSAYQGQCHIERVFKHFKNPYHHAVRPQYHWTDQKIKVHTFICLIGLLLSQVLWKKANEMGYNLTPEKLISKLSDIRKVQIITMTSLEDKPKIETQLEEMEPDLKEMFDALMG